MNETQQTPRRSEALMRLTENMNYGLFRVSLFSAAIRWAIIRSDLLYIIVGFDLQPVTLDCVLFSPILLRSLRVFLGR